jgi:3-oxoacyl-[acyl-carrier-protein] synthase I
MTVNGATAVTGIGMTTPVGLTAAQSCAALRAGISALAELEYYVLEEDGFPEGPLSACAIRDLTDGYLGLGRWTRLAASALTDLVAAARLSPADLASAGLYLALPPLTRGGVDPQLVDLLPVRLAERVRASGLERRTRVYTDGHAAGARAIQDALADVQSGAVARALVCGVDSLVEPETLRFLAEKRRLRTPDQADGFLPGEAAACLVLESAHAAVTRGARPLATVDSASIALEPVTIWADAPSAGTGLSDAARSALEQLADRGKDTRLVVCDLNGESYRAREFGNTAARVFGDMPAKWAVWHPADCIGDTGSAAFIVSACVGVQALAKGYAKSDRVMVLGSSDDGLRGAVSMRRVSVEA